MVEKLLAVQRQYLRAQKITIYYVGGGGKYFNLGKLERFQHPNSFTACLGLGLVKLCDGQISSYSVKVLIGLKKVDVYFSVCFHRSEELLTAHAQRL